MTMKILAGSLQSARWRSSLKLAIGLALLALLIVNVDGERLLAALGRADPVLASLGITAFVVMVAIDAWRLQIAFRRYHLTLRRSAEIQAVGFFLSSFTPGMAGADLLRVGVAHRIEPGLPGPIALAMLLRVFGLLAMATLTGLWFISFPGRLAGLGERLDPRIPSWLESPEIVLLGLLVASVLALLIGRHARAREAARTAWGAVGGLGLAGLTTLAAVTLLMVFAGAVSLYLLSRAVAIDVHGADMIVVLTLLTFGSLVPLGPGGIGLREGAITAGLVAFGAASAPALAVAILHRLSFWIVSFVGWVVFMRWRKMGNA